jgi:hypothetical protein
MISSSVRRLPAREVMPAAAASSAIWASTGGGSAAAGRGTTAAGRRRLGLGRYGDRRGPAAAARRVIGGGADLGRTLFVAASKFIEDAINSTPAVAMAPTRAPRRIHPNGLLLRSALAIRVFL